MLISFLFAILVACSTDEDKQKDEEVKSADVIENEGEQENSGQKEE